MTTVFAYNVTAIPDCTDYRLVTQYGGNARERIFRASEHLLRVVANFGGDQIGLAFRYLFNPSGRDGLQQRLRLQAVLRIAGENPAETARQLIESGPLSEFYTFESMEDYEQQTGLDQGFKAVCELVRQEEGIEPLVSREENDRIPSLYYALYPFECREENDYLTLDRLLSRLETPCVVEILVQPVRQASELAAHYGYIMHLMSINAYGDEPFGGIPASEPWAEDRSGSQVLTPARKKDPIADEILREHQDLQRTLRQPQLLFHIKAFAMRSEHALMLASTVAESGLSGGKYRIVSYDSRGGNGAKEMVQQSLADSQSLNVSLHALHPDIWNRHLPPNWRGLKRLCRMATVDELKGLCRLPVGGYGSPRCIRKATDPLRQERSGTILIGDDLESQPPEKRQSPDDLSGLFECRRQTNLELRLALDALAKHVFVAGVPGSGKTTALFNLLVQLCRHGVPFLVIEPAKTEYRVLKTLRDHPDESVRQMAERIRVYTPGNDTISPLRFNPLEYPQGVSLDEHIGQLLACFEAAMPMEGPLQALIAEAIEAVYEGREENDFPRMADLVEAAPRIMAAKEYEGEVRSNVQAAIAVRLGLLTRRAMGRIFQCHRSIPNIAELLESPAVIEMDYLSQDHACLLTLFLLGAIREHIRIDPRRRSGGLRHVTVIEEAHNIVGRTGEAKASPDVADPRAFAARYVSRMLAEVRALGEGIIIADQLPSAVAPEVVKNTGTKLAHRLVSNDDREDLGGAMLLGATEIEELARLLPGEAYFYTEGLHKPRRVRGLNANAYLRLGESPTAAEIVPHMAEDQWFTDGQEERLLMTLDVMKGHLMALLDAIQETMAKARVLVPHQVNLAAAIEDPLRRREELTHVYATLIDLRDQLQRRVNTDFHNKVWIPHQQDMQLGCTKFEAVRQSFDAIVDKYNDDVLARFGEVNDTLNTVLGTIGEVLDEPEDSEADDDTTLMERLQVADY